MSAFPVPWRSVPKERNAYHSAFLRIFSIYHAVYMIFLSFYFRIASRSPFQERGTHPVPRSKECGTYPVPRSRSGERNAYSFFLFFITEHITGTSISMHMSCWSGNCMTFSFISNKKCTIPTRGVGVPRSLAFRSQGTERISYCFFKDFFNISYSLYDFVCHFTSNWFAFLVPGMGNAYPFPVPKNATPLFWCLHVWYTHS